MIASFHSSKTGASREATKRVPRFTPRAEHQGRPDAAPVEIPPDAITGIGATVSTTCGAPMRLDMPSREARMRRVPEEVLVLMAWLLGYLSNVDLELS